MIPLLFSPALYFQEHQCDGTILSFYKYLSTIEAFGTIAILPTYPTQKNLRVHGLWLSKNKPLTAAHAKEPAG